MPWWDVGECSVKRRGSCAGLIALLALTLTACVTPDGGLNQVITQFVAALRGTAGRPFPAALLIRSADADQVAFKGRLAKALEVSVAELVGGIQSKREEEQHLKNL